MGEPCTTAMGIARAETAATAAGDPCASLPSLRERDARRQRPCATLMDPSLPAGDAPPSSSNVEGPCVGDGITKLPYLSGLRIVRPPKPSPSSCSRSAMRAAVNFVAGTCIVILVPARIFDVVIVVDCFPFDSPYCLIPF
ncbi:hypothetical protein PR202_ga23262 [Eleusine coracana subsp. coracana]|uniref:Uncharacterized protein n=1 Tax=Eleusine coracana subsp. coracana TaxID=191504 RepID=A0AAV5D5E7_ELECO|nr:hypothetical protein PR202_ga23262 [Eleusine coracana subsp. coracana]